MDLKKFIKRLFSYAINLLLNKRNLYLEIHKESKFESKSKRNNFYGKISIGKNSDVFIDENVKIIGCLIIGENCKVKIYKNSLLDNINFNFSNNSDVIIEEGCIFDIPNDKKGYIIANNGKIHFKEKVHCKASILSRFGGYLTIGKCTDIGYETQITCEEKIEIGDYCLISYDVCIYDTNSHSTNWQDRRDLFDRGYPNCVDEIIKPKTKEVIIGNDVWLGKSTTILKGTYIGNRCIVGIRTVVGGGKYDDDSIIITSKPKVISKKLNTDE